MITKTDYLKAKKVVADYELSNGIKLVVIKSVCDLPKCVYCLDEGWVFPCKPCEHCNEQTVL